MIKGRKGGERAGKGKGEKLILTNSKKRHIRVRAAPLSVSMIR
jgi:hypothetical protein